MITSISNPRIKNLIQLQKKGKARREQQCFVVEGLKMVLEAPTERLKAIYMSENFSRGEEQRQAVEKKAAASGCLWVGLSDKGFKAASETMSPQGVLAVVSMVSFDWQQLALQKSGGKRMILILESLQDPGNLGTILRTGEGAGIDGIILNRTSVDPYMPKVIRSTMGSIYRVPVAVAEDLEVVVTRLKESGTRV